MRRGQRDFVNRLQGQYNNDAVVQAEKLKQKEDARRLERIAKCEKMGLGLGTRLGTAAGPPTPVSRNKENNEGQRRSFVNKAQEQYDRDAVVRAEKLKKKEEEKRQEQLLKFMENAVGEGGHVIGAHALGTGGLPSQPPVSDAEARRRNVARLQAQYRDAREHQHPSGTTPS